MGLQKNCEKCGSSGNCSRCGGDGRVGMFGDVTCGKCSGGGRCDKCGGDGNYMCYCAKCENQSGASSSHGSASRREQRRR